MVVDIAQTPSTSYLGPEFNDFLFAPVGEDGNGMLVSVLSALARLDVDPWDEAAKLARLPAEHARQRLSSLIATIPDGTLAKLDPRAIAVRLVALLPGNVPSSKKVRGTVPVTDWRLIMLAAVLVVVLGVQFIVGYGRSPANTIDAPASDPRSSHISLPKSND